MKYIDSSVKEGYVAVDKDVEENGAVTPISVSTGKCLDYHVMSKSSKCCQTWWKWHNDQNYNEWENKHNCCTNYKKLLGAMEAPGALKIVKLVIAIKKEAEPIFRDFSSEALLLKFFNGLT